MNERDELFLTSRQPVQKLSVAVTRYFTEDSLNGTLKKRYADYIQQHLYSALEWILQHKETLFLEQLLSTGWLDASTVRRGLKNQKIPTDMRLLLLRFLAPDECSKEAGTAHGSALDILLLCQLHIFEQMPEMRLAISGFLFQETANENLTGTDGYTIYYSPGHVMRSFTHSEHVELYLHMMIHCLYLHLEVPSGADYRLWNLACDVSAWFLSEQKFKICGQTRRQLHNRIYERFPPEVSPALSLQVYEWIRRQENQNFVEQWTVLFKMDGHEYWHQASCSAGERLRRLQKSSVGFSVPVRHRFGLNPGSRLEEAELQKKARYDFRAYLRRFTVTAEELQTDPDSFDYIPYLYGLFRYKNLPLVEPLEYTEATKVEELVIAIDTSGSCKLDTIQQFLAETCRILTEHQNFFHRMNVHIIQCDSMIQEHVRIHSIEDWNRYIQNIKISGRGGTDFTPVFTLVSSLIGQGEFRNLKGLFYFTDGDGVYPKDTPSYETAFIFADYRFLNYNIPDWAVRLCLDLSEGENTQ